MKRRIFILTGAGAFSLILFLVGSNGANARSYGNGTCWQAGPRTCQYNFQPTHYQYFYVERHLTTQHGSDWAAAISAAMTSWNNAPGPQYVYDKNSSPNYPYTSIWLWESSIKPDPLNWLGSSLAITWNRNYPDNAYCYLDTACNIWYADIYLNSSTLPGAGVAGWQWTMAHELGHVIGLAHSDDSATLMYVPWSGNPYGVNGPTTGDVGTNPTCSGETLATRSVRCIYNW